MHRDDRLPILPRGCVAGCLTIAAALAVVLLVDDWERARRIVLLVVWASMLGESLYKGALPAPPRWRATRADRPLVYWAVVALMAGVTTAALFLVLQP